MSILQKKYPKGKTLDKLFSEMKDGDTRVFPAIRYNVGSMRTIAAKLNTKAGYTRYAVNDDRKVTNSIRIICSPKD